MIFLGFDLLLRPVFDVGFEYSSDTSKLPAALPYYIFYIVVTKE